MDVYLAPLIKELQTLWTGVRVIDMSQTPTRRTTMIQGILMWTMHDWQGYGDCAGFQILGYNMHVRRFVDSILMQDRRRT